MIKKALITSAGYGTRLLPITKTIQKEMLPILNRPIIDYIVSDCVSAGIEEIIFVVKDGKECLVEHFFTEFDDLEQYLKKMGKFSQFEGKLRPYEDVKFSFVRQKSSDNYGTAIPVQLAKEQLIGEEAFLVFMGDDFIFNGDQTSNAKKMIELFEKSNSKGLVTCITKPDEELHKYGVAEVREENGFTYLTNLVEKPEPGTAPSNLTNISKYVFTPEIFDIIDQQKPNDSNGEYYITDSATILAQNNNVCIYKPGGRYLDGGTLSGWLKANVVVAKSDPELAEELREFVKQEFEL